MDFYLVVSTVYQSVMPIIGLVSMVMMGIMYLEHRKLREEIGNLPQNVQPKQRRPYRRKLSSAQIDTLRKLHKQRAPIGNIAQQFGISKATVWNYTRKN